MGVAQIRPSLLQYWHSLWTQEATDYQLPRALFCFPNTRTTRPNLTQAVHPVLLKRAKRKMSQIKWGMSQEARELSWILVLHFYNQNIHTKLMFSYRYYWCYTNISNIGIGTGGVTQWSNEAGGIEENKSWSHGERENRENLERNKTLSNFYMFSWR